ncbi:unnamed protein product [Phytophthora fragariaefolia]|uniref:Unnamed protein product n=1 Tax=Phytophthora fragariaefolia TaxID=1490495 RepID=A0A9W6XJA9_9STRA|nr:unnamed protein product [Phytophthora fragariaefolia]
MAQAPPASPPPTRKPRRTFHIQLGGEPAEINFKQLATGGAASAPSGGSSSSSGGVAPRGRPQRFNIIEHLEKRYGGGAVLHDGGDVGGGPVERRDDDDLYDSEDSFIDDSELQQTIEDARGQTRVRTKHAGFFVNAGEEIETLEQEDGDGDAGGKRAADGALRSFLDRVPDAAGDWQPDEQVVKKLESNMLRLEARDVAKNEREKLDTALEAIAQHIAVYGTRAVAEPADTVKAGTETNLHANGLFPLMLNARLDIFLFRYREGQRAGHEAACIAGASRRVGLQRK